MHSPEDQLGQFFVGQDDWERLPPKECIDPFLSESSNHAVEVLVDPIHCLDGKVGHVAFR